MGFMDMQSAALTSAGSPLSPGSASIFDSYSCSTSSRASAGGSSDISSFSL